MTALVKDINTIGQKFSRGFICGYRSWLHLTLLDEKGFYEFLHAELAKCDGSINFVDLVCRYKCRTYNRPAQADYLRREWLATCVGDSIITPEWVEATLAKDPGTGKFLDLIDEAEMLLKSDPQMRLCLALTTAWQRHDSGYDVPYTALIRSVRREIQPYTMLEGWIENKKTKNSLPTDWKSKSLNEIRLTFIQDWRSYYS